MLLGSYNRAFAYAQKHWWHIGLKPSVDGFSTVFTPMQKKLKRVDLPDQARFFVEVWSGIVMSYDLFRKSPQPENLLVGLLQSAYETVNEEY